MGANSDVQNYDAAMNSERSAKSKLKWYDFTDAPFRFYGSFYCDPAVELRRLPDDPALSDAVRYLSTHTAGMRVDFRTDSTQVAVRVKLRSVSHMDHMPPVGAAGFDLYVNAPAKPCFLGVTRFPYNAEEYESVIIDHMPSVMRGFILNFPLYSGVSSLQIGLDEDAELLPPEPWADEAPIIVYGTSITQGGCANRPGMVYSSILSREYNRPVLNLGFSGNGRGEPEVAEYLAGIENPGMYILDYESNVLKREGIQHTLAGFIDILRAKHPETPIVLISAIRFNHEIVFTGTKGERIAKIRDSIAFQKEEVRRRNEAGDKNICFIDGSELRGELWTECAVDGSHQTDLGFWLMAQDISAKIKDILG